MAYKFNLFFTFLLACFMGSIVAARPMIMSSKSTLLARLKLDQDGSSTCWDSLFQLQSCSGEVILFFLNGETYLGPGCCRAIRTIEHDCWPSMLGSVGFTAEEGDILRGYCDASASESTPKVATPPPPPSIVSPNKTMSHAVVT